MIARSLASIARLVCRIGGDAAARGPAEEGGGARHLQVAADLRGADGRVLEADVEPMQEEQRVRLARRCRARSAWPRGSRRRMRHAPAARRVGRAGGRRGDRGAAAASRSPLPVSPKRCASGTCTSTRPRVDPSVALGGEAGAAGGGHAVGAEPDRIDHAIGLISAGCCAPGTARRESRRVRARWRTIQFRQQRAHLALHAGAVSGLGGQTLQDRLGPVACASGRSPARTAASRSASRIGEWNVVGSLGVGIGGRFLDRYSLFERRLAGLLQELIHGGLQFGQVPPGAGGAIARAGGKRGRPAVRPRGVRSSSVPAAWARRKCDGVVAQRDLERPAQPGDESVNEGGKPVTGRFGEGGRRAAALEIDGQVVVRDGAVVGIGQLLARGRGRGAPG